MYLVLTAILALNVSKEILDAFVLVNDGLMATNKNFGKKTDGQYTSFDNAKLLDEKKVRPNWEKAQLIKKETREFISYINDLKKLLTIETEGISPSEADTAQLVFSEKKDNMDIPTSVMIGNSEDGSAGKSRELKERIIGYKKFLESFIEKADREKIQLGLNTDDPKNSESNENWELYNFYNLPFAAIITNLSRIENDIKKGESDVVEYLYKQVFSDDIPFDTIAAKVIAPSNYVLLGDEYKAEVFLAAFSRTKNPSVYTGDYDFDNKKFNGQFDSVTVNAGTGLYTNKPNKEGLVKWGGELVMVSPKGERKVYPFKSEYMVARPAVSVAPTMMNVFYKGVGNPVTISVPGVPNENLVVVCDNGTFTKKGNGSFEVLPSRLGKSKISVSAKMQDGQVRSMGVMEFRVKPLPTPVATINNVKTNKISKSLLKAVQGPIATYPEDFVFNVSTKVTGFKFQTNIGGVLVEDQSKDGKFTATMKDYIEKLRKGAIIFFDDVKTVGPDGVPVIINFSIQII